LLPSICISLYPAGRVYALVCKQSCIFKAINAMFLGITCCIKSGKLNKNKPSEYIFGNAMKNQYA